MENKQRILLTVAILVVLATSFYFITKAITNYTGYAVNEGGNSSNADLCLSKGINGYPTWEINGKLYPGEQSFEKLGELAGCDKNSSPEELAKCLSEKGVKMYGAFWCGHCQNEKEAFQGNLEKYNIYFECDPRA